MKLRETSCVYDTEGPGRKGGKGPRKGAPKKGGRAEAVRVKKLIVRKDKRKGVMRPEKGPMGMGIEPQRKSRRLS